MAGVEERMVAGDPRLSAGGRGLGEPAGVGQLQGHQQIVGGAMVLPMACLHRTKQLGKPLSAAGWSAQLPGIGTPLRHHRHRLAPPDQLGTAGAKPLPATQERLGRQALGCRVPAFHRMDAPAVPHLPAAERNWRGQRRAFRG